jgi:hypothetical protein
MNIHAIVIVSTSILCGCVGSNPSVPNEAVISARDDSGVLGSAEVPDSTQVENDAGSDVQTDSSVGTEEGTSDASVDMRILPSFVELSVLAGGEYEVVSSIPYEFRNGFGIGPGSTTGSFPTDSGVSLVEFSWSIWMEIVDEQACFDVELAGEVQEPRCISSTDEPLEYPFVVDEHRFLFSVGFEESRRATPSCIFRPPCLEARNSEPPLGSRL